MEKTNLAILMFSLLTACNNVQDKPTSKNDRLYLVPEPDKAERSKYEALQRLKKSGCVFLNPDTSLCGIKIRNPKSTIAAIGNKDTIDSFEQYQYRSKGSRENLTLTQHPGDRQFQISIFKVTFSDSIAHGYRQLPVDTFKTEKGIKLGLSKKEITARLGSCYAAIDSTKDYIELYYEIETPNDSKTQFLKTNNMPIYFASYKILNDKLVTFEFGFEYP